MRRKLIILIIFLIGIFFLLTLYNDMFSLFKKSSLPAALPKKLVIEYSESGGMLPEWKHIYISRDSSFLEFSNLDAKSKNYFKLTEEELKNLYQLFIDNKFDKIQTKKVMIYDAGGSQINLHIDTKFIGKGSGATSSIADKWEDNYYTIVSTIQKVAEQKLESLKQEIKIVFDPSILNSNKIIQFAIQNIQTYYSSEKEGIKPELNLHLLPGGYYMDLYLLERIEKNSPLVTYTYIHSKFEIDKNTKEIIFSLVDKNIDSKIIN